MGNIFTLGQVEKAGIIRQFIDLFSKYSGLEFQFSNIDTILVQFSCHLQEKAYQCKRKSSNCNQISQHILNQIMEFKSPRVHACPAGLKKIAIPLFFNNEIIGIMFATENGSFRFNWTQADALSALLFQTINYVIKNELNPLNNFKTNVLTYQQELLYKVIKYMRDNYHQNHLSLEDVAGNNGLSYHYLSRLFKKELKITFVQYRNKIRMEAAAKLLIKRRDLTIGQVASTCGFDDPYYFSRVFKATYGICPIKFKKKKLLEMNRRYSKKSEEEQKYK